MRAARGFLIKKLFIENKFPLGDDKQKMDISELNMPQRHTLKAIIDQLFNTNRDTQTDREILDQNEQLEFKKVIISPQITGKKAKKNNKKVEDIIITAEKLEKLFQFFIRKKSLAAIETLQNPDTTSNQRIRAARELAEFYKQCGNKTAKKEIMWALILALKQDTDISIRRTAIKQLSYGRVA